MDKLKGKSSTRAKNKYNVKTYDNIRVVVKKGEKEVITQHAQDRSESINGFVNRAIIEPIQRDKAGDTNESL